MLKILYVHGFIGKANGNAATLVRKALNDNGLDFSFDAPNFPVTNPLEMKKILKEKRKEFDLLIASSLGAFYAMQEPGVFKILVNPALPKDLKQFNDPLLSENFFKELEKQKDFFFDTALDDEFMYETFLIFGSQDSIAPNKEFFESQYFIKDQVKIIEMEHRIDEIGARAVYEALIHMLSRKPYFDRTEKVILDALKNRCL